MVIRKHELLQVSSEYPLGCVYWREVADLIHGCPNNTMWKRYREIEIRLDDEEVTINAQYPYYNCGYEYTLLHSAAESNRLYPEGDEVDIVKVVQDLIARGANTKIKLKPTEESIKKFGKLFNLTALDIAIERVADGVEYIQETVETIKVEKVNKLAKEGKFTVKKVVKYNDAPSAYNIIKLISGHDKSERNSYTLKACIVMVACIGISLVISNLWVLGCLWTVGLAYIGVCSYEAYQYQQELNKITPEIKAELKVIDVEPAQNKNLLTF